MERGSGAATRASLVLLVVLLPAHACVRAGFSVEDAPGASDRGGAIDGARDRSRAEWTNADRTIADRTNADRAIADRASADRAIADRPVDAPPCAPSSSELAIVSPADDGEIDGAGAYYPAGEPGGQGDAPGIYVGWWATGPTWGYLRFAVVKPIAASATVTRARLALLGVPALKSSAAWNQAQHALRVAFEDSSDAPQVKSGADRPGAPGGRPLLPGVRWPAAGGLTWKDTADNTVDLEGALQQLVTARGGIAAGAHLQLWIRGDFSGTSAEVATVDAGAPPGKPARLSLEWCQ